MKGINGKQQDLYPHNTVQHLSQLINLMVRIKAWAEEPQSIPFGTDITIAVDLLQQALDELDHSSDEYRQLGFIVEQLQLIRWSYSPQLLLCRTNCMLQVQQVTPCYVIKTSSAFCHCGMQITQKNGPDPFVFDRVFDESESTIDIFVELTR